MKDLFSHHAASYATFRPTYPPDLYEFIYHHVKHFDTAWDAGTGNGQAARVLAKRFKKVIATDVSHQQIAQAEPLSNAEYRVGGEEVSLPDHSVDLITVAQAVHWFDREKFYHEVNRVGKEGAVIAVWGYGLLRINPKINALIGHFYTEVIGSFWDAERHLIDDHFKSLDFPFREIPTPSFEFSFHWDLEQLRGYLGTWSAVRKYIEANKSDPVTKLIEEIRILWGKDQLRVTFPLFLRMGSVGL